MQKSIRRDEVGDATVAIRPARFVHDATVIVIVRCGALDRERAKRVLTADPGRRPIEARAIERSRERELESTSKWRIGLLIGAHVVAIAPGRGAITCVKLGTHFGR